MQKGIKTRLIIHEMLFSLKNNLSTYDELLKKNILKNSFSASDIAMIQNVVLSSMRNNYNIITMLEKYVDKKINTDTYLLLLSAITQLIYLEFKDYAVVNSMVEIAKNKNIKTSPGLINAVLKKIIKEKNLLHNIKPNKKNLPNWFLKQIPDWDKNLIENFLSNIIIKPDLHIVFKNKNYLDKFNIERDHKDIQTSEISLCVKNSKKISELPRYIKGEWWVQDFSTMMPLYYSSNLINKDVIDLCAAPGGKSFQVLSAGGNLDINEINIKRAKILQENLNRLKFYNKINIIDSLKMKINKKYDIIIIDAPCSSVGTIRKNPEILFRKNNIDVSKFISYQEMLLKKAKELSKKNSEIIYMVCSFFDSETTKQVDKFLKENKNFMLKKFSQVKDNPIVNSDGCIKVLPSKLKNGVLIDGFFAAKLIRND